MSKNCTYRLKEPFTYEDKTYSELVLDFDRLTGNDAMAIETEMQQNGTGLIQNEAWDGSYQTAVASKVYVGGASNVTVTVKSMTYATNEQLETHTGNKENPHKVTKKQVGLGDVPNVTTNNQTPTYQTGTTLEKLKSGEKLSNAMGKIACAVNKLIDHLNETVPIKKGGTGATNGSDAINGLLKDGTVNLSRYQFGGNINVPGENGTIYFELISDTATGWVMAKPFIFVEEK